MWRLFQPQQVSNLFRQLRLMQPRNVLHTSFTMILIVSKDLLSRFGSYLWLRTCYNLHETLKYHSGSLPTDKLACQSQGNISKGKSPTSPQRARQGAAEAKKQADIPRCPVCGSELTSELLPAHCCFSDRSRPHAQSFWCKVPDLCMPKASWYTSPPKMPSREVNLAEALKRQHTCQADSCFLAQEGLMLT